MGLWDRLREVLRKLTLDGRIVAETVASHVFSFPCEIQNLASTIDKGSNQHQPPPLQTHQLMIRNRMAASALSSYMVPAERVPRLRADSLEVASEVRGFASEGKVLREVMRHERFHLGRGRAVQ